MPMARILMRIVQAGLLIVVLLVVALAVAPILFKSKLLAAARDQVNAYVDAEVDFKDAAVSLISTFPVFELAIDGPTIDGVGPFEGERLLAADRAEVGVDLWALVFESRIEVTDVALRSPKVRLIVDETGRANYDIAKKTDTATAAPASGETAFRITRYAITDGAVVYRTPTLEVNVSGLDHQGSADIKGATQILASQTKIRSLSVTQAESVLLKEVAVQLDVDGTVDGDRRQLELRKADLGMNELGLKTSGSVDYSGEQVRLDIAAKSKENGSIKGLLSLIPNAQTANFGGVTAQGTFSLDGKVNGVVGDAGLPPLTVALRVADGQFKYPDRPLPVRDVAIDARLEHPGGGLDRARLDVSTFKLAVGDSRASGRIKATKIQSKPTVDLKVDGRIETADLEKALPLDLAQYITGRIDASVEVAGPVDRPSRVEGTVAMSNATIRSTATPIDVRIAKVRFGPEQTQVETFALKTKNSDLTVKGTLSPLTSILMGKAPIKADLEVTGQQLVAEDFMAPAGDKPEAPPAAGDKPEAPPAEGSKPEAPPAEGSKPGTPPAEGTGLVLPDNVDATLNLAVGRFQMGTLELSDVKGKAGLKDRTLTLNDVKAAGLGGRMAVNGKLVTAPSRPANLEIAYSLADAVFADTFKAFGFLQTVAPIVGHLTGRFGTDLKFSGAIGPDGALKLDSIDADGFLATSNSKLTDFKPLNALARAIPKIQAPLAIKRAKANFTVDNGALRVKEFPLDAGGLKLLVGGRHGLDQQMRYTISTKVPIKALRTTSLANKVKAFGADVKALTEAKVTAVLTGSVGSPQVAFDVALPGANEVVKQVVDKGVKKVSKAALKLLDDARLRADKVRKEAEKAAQKVESEADGKASKLESSAKGNPLKLLAAKQGAKVIRQQGRSAAQKLIDEAAKQAKQIIADAEAKAQQLK